MQRLFITTFLLFQLVVGTRAKTKFGFCPPQLTPDEVYRRFGKSQKFYIDYNNGNDSWNGNLPDPDEFGNGPFKTFAGAITGMRQTKKCVYAASGVVLYVRGGTHFVDKTVVIDERDNSLSIVAYPGDERPLISGAHRIPGSEFSKLDDKIYFAPYEGHCTKNVFLGRKRLLRARKPSVEEWTGENFTGEGPYLKIDNLLVNTEECNYDGTGGFKQACPPENGDGFVYADNDINPNWSNLQKADILVFQAWIAERGDIGEIDTKNKTVYFQERLRTPIGTHPEPSGWRYIVENVYEELDSVGEYYCDEGKGMFYFIPPEGALDTEDVYIATTEVVFEAMYGEDIGFYNLEFRHGHDGNFEGYMEDPGLLQFVSSSKLTIERCCFSNLGHTAIYVHACTDVNITESIFTDIGYFAIGAKFDDDFDNPMANKNINIHRNTFQRCGVVNMFQPACIIAQGIENIKVTNNDIGFSPYAGIRIGWQATFHWSYVETDKYVFYVERNHVHDFGLGLLNDFAGIYLSSNPECSEATLSLATCYLHAYVSRNVIHKTIPYNYGGKGVYGDTAASGLVVTENWLYDLSEAAVNFHCGRYNYALNNMIHQVADGRVFGVCNSIVGGNENEPLYQIMIFKENVIYVSNVDARLWRKSDLWDFFVPNLDHNDYFFNPANDTQKKDFFPAREQGKGVSFKQWQNETGRDLHSIIKNPLYVDMENEDFRLDCQSPALDLGIKSIDNRHVRRLSGIFGV
ncbi:uncharacterized protein LOC143469724 [Clavelina lepadiformis]|uniref:Right handed beta helix domain-containing protein n=1 Tax=Clavelina lepadiformis TaxID=159417 RepID=A0ABP0F8V7_CLALP